MKNRFLLEMLACLRIDIQPVIGSSIEHIEKLKTGMTNLNFKCRTETGTYIIRIPGEGTSQFINREDEWKIHQKIDPIELNVRTLFFDKDTGVKVTDYVEDSAILIGTDLSTIGEVSAILRKLHRSEILLDNIFSPFEKLDEYYSICNTKDIKLEGDYYLILHRLRKIHQSLSSSMSFQSPCHNDPVIENFLKSKNGKYYLIDWEYAGMNDPLWDLAAFSLENNLTSDQEGYLLCHYFDNSEIHEITHACIMYHKVCQDMLWYLWARIKMHFKDDLGSYAQMRLLRAKDTINETSKYKIEYNYECNYPGSRKWDQIEPSYEANSQAPHRRSG